jgi:hypothetical protein
MSQSRAGIWPSSTPAIQVRSSVGSASIHLDVYPQRCEHSLNGYVRYKVLILFYCIFSSCICRVHTFAYSTTWGTGGDSTWWSERLVWREHRRPGFDPRQKRPLYKKRRTLLEAEVSKSVEMAVNVSGNNPFSALSCIPQSFEYSFA